MSAVGAVFVTYEAALLPFPIFIALQFFYISTTLFYILHSCMYSFSDNSPRRDLEILLRNVKKSE